MTQNFTLKVLCACVLSLFLVNQVSAQNVLFSEDFQGGLLPDGWTIETNATDDGYVVGTASQLQSQYLPINAHTTFIGTNDDACDCDKSNDILNLPNQDFSDLNFETIIMTFDHFFPNGDEGGDERAYFEYKKADASTWKTHELEGGADWINEYKVAMTGVSGQSDVQMRFRYDDGDVWNFGLFLDNIEVSAPEFAIEGQIDETTTVIMQGEDVIVNISNNGGNTINSFDIVYSIDGAAEQTLSVEKVDLGSFQTYEVVLLEAFDKAPGVYEVNLVLQNINNGETDEKLENNTFNQYVNVINEDEIPEQKVLLEEATGTWCGWCPRGHIFNEIIEEKYPDQAIIVAVHNADPMADPSWDAVIGNYIQGYPSGVADRAVEVDPADFEAVLNNRLNNGMPLAAVTTEADFDPVTRELTVTVTSNFIIQTRDEYRINAMVVEMNVTGTSAGYNQVNYYSGGAAGPMDGYENLSDPVPAADMVYNHVGRKLLGGQWGEAGSLPSDLIVKGEDYSYTFNYTVPASYKPEDLRIIGTVQKFAESVWDRNIVNVSQIELELPVTAAYSAEPDNETGMVTFEDRSIGAVSWVWSFGDGSEAVEGAGPHEHLYTQNGDYEVTLVVTDADGNEATYTETVTVAVAPVADFTFEQSEESTAFVTVTDKSTFAESWSWVFITDGEAFDVQNPEEFEYTANGVYEVCLTVTNEVGENTDCKEVVVAEKPSALFDFTIDDDEYSISVTENSTFAEEWAWDFGDDSDLLLEQSPEDHIYEEAGDYTVCLKVSNGVGLSTKCEDITIVEKFDGINDLAFFGTIDIFPSPAVDVVNISYELNELLDLQISITNVLGQQIENINTEQNIGLNTLKLDASNYTNGIYFVNFVSGNNTYSKRFVISK